MAEETLVKEILTSEMILGGRDLIERLDNTELDITAAFWFYFMDSMRWNLTLGIAQVLNQGPLKSINMIQKLLSDHPIDGVDFSEVLVLQSDHSIIKRLRTLVETGKEIKGIRISKAVVESVFIQEAYIYRLIWRSEFRRLAKLSKSLQQARRLKP